MISPERQGELNFVKRVATMIRGLHNGDTDIYHVDVAFCGVLCSMTFHFPVEIILKHNASGLVMNLRHYENDEDDVVWIGSGDDKQRISLKDAITAAIGVSKVYLGYKLRGSNKNDTWPEDINADA